jgi:osmotically inducible protein OsmC
MAIRKANAQWQGGLKGGQGQMELGSGAFKGQYSFSSRFEEGTGTNPEELIGAAHAGCFSMALSGELEKAGFDPSSVQTNAQVHLDPQEGGGFSITRVKLITEGEVPGMDDQQFQEIAEGAKANCPVSRALTGVSIEVSASLK